MSKYEPLRRYLERIAGHEHPMTFEDVERVVGFALPPSARAHATWWSNNTGTHVGVKAWRDAGWRTSRVDLPGGKLVFVRETTAVTPSPQASGEALRLDLRDLSLAARKLLAEYAGEAGGDAAAAACRAIHEAAVARRGRLIDCAAARSPQVSDDSVDLIREDRDGR